MVGKVTVPLKYKVERLLPPQVMLILKFASRVGDKVPSVLCVNHIVFEYKVTVMFEPLIPPEYENAVPSRLPVFVVLKLTLY